MEPFLIILVRNEISGTVYSYSLYHVTLCLANMYITMQLTQWFQPQVHIVLYVYVIVVVFIPL